jgi:hypothetical protein
MMTLAAARRPRYLSQLRSCSRLRKALYNYTISKGRKKSDNEHLTKSNKER